MCPEPPPGPQDLKRARLCITILSVLSIELTAQWVIIMQKVVIVTVEVIVITLANLYSTCDMPDVTITL